MSAAAETKQFRELSGQDAAQAFHVIGVVGHTPGDLDSELFLDVSYGSTTSARFPATA